MYSLDVSAGIFPLSLLLQYFACVCNALLLHSHVVICFIVFDNKYCNGGWLLWQSSYMVAIL